jgi:hypothetical protein
MIVGRERTLTAGVGICRYAFDIPSDGHGASDIMAPPTTTEDVVDFMHLSNHNKAQAAVRSRHLPR